MTKNKNRCRFIFFMLGLIALLMLFACTLTRSKDLVEAMGLNSPEEWIISEYSIGPMSDPVILSQRRLANGLLYLLTFQSANKYGNKDESFAFRFFINNPRGNGFSEDCGAGYTRGSSPPRSPLLDYEILICKSQNDSYVVVYGKAIDPRVNRVKIGYDQGDYLSMIENGVFGEVIPRQVKLCSLSILSKDDQVLEHVDLTKGYPDQTNPAYARPEDCSSE